MATFSFLPLGLLRRVAHKWLLVSSDPASEQSQRERALSKRKVTALFNLFLEVASYHLYRTLFVRSKSSLVTEKPQERKELLFG